ncbi:MAG: hypothetical protein HPY76_07060 [Anaerolineae bacterium]|nr:hypothetical protein [Anaerolineae bacterium]
MVTMINILLFIGFVYVMMILIASSNRSSRRVGVAFALLIILPFWGLQHWSILVKSVLALGVVLIASWLLLRPSVIPAWLKKRWFVFVYFGCLMFLIFIWSVFAESPVFSFPALGVPAMVAAICLFRKSWLEMINSMAGRSNHA